MIGKIQIFCLKCKEITTLKTNGERAVYYEQYNSIWVGKNQIKCKCGHLKLKYNGYLSKGDL